MRTIFQGFVITLALFITACNSTQVKSVNDSEFTDAREMRIFLLSVDTILNSIEEISFHNRVLAVQSANGIYTPEERDLLDYEFNEMFLEIERMKKYTVYQNKLLISPDGLDKKISISFVRESNRIDVELPELSLTRIFSKSGSEERTNLKTPSDANIAIGRIDELLHDIEVERTRILTMYNRLGFVVHLEDNLGALKNTK